MKPLYLAEAEAQGLKVSDKPVRRLGFIILIVVFGLGGLWAGFAPLDSAVLAQGYVTVKSSRKTVQHLEGGIVKELLVHDGDHVHAGDVLMRLDDTQAKAQLEAARSQLIAAQALEARLIAERDDRNEVTFGPSDFPEDDKRVQEARNSERQIFIAQRNARLGEIDVLKNKSAELEQQIRGFEAIMQSKQGLSKSYGSEIKDLSELLKQGYVNNERLRDQERNLSRLQGEIADQQSAIARAKVQIGETKLQILQTTQKFKSDVANKLAETQSRIYELRERVGALQDLVNRMVIRAPVDGMVMGLAVHTIGGVVAPGTHLLDIVPIGADLLVEVEVQPNDIDRIEVGKLAEVRFSAFKNATTPILEGKVVYISADRFTNERTGAPYYLARVALTEKGVQDLGRRELVPGMPAEVLINTGARTLLNYLLKPARNAMARSMIEE
ncbi:hemolysin secretion protein D [Pseudomonas oryzihabitans]|uniref:HlyD family type I secretion periplasmic adaptor subunit n=1 Tax=Pseudomonas rhizoryzae TaxID=2571129 RepID=UPI0007360BBB|nr:HlyD family type I secretion periplasmic adaptor subunit [Pseudomonas rhizoryzae]KTT31901.1 hemolysin secretion protein D [Pseudomonas psychrotolerans]KTT37216.1 hemolysin secretion protein D [Pseudomonas psychrotolerans]KTT41130.1 hemolysin secretion protein D [Pseudomonas psychrotolerans]KTT46067.1 hemolysin secretion protein D [Pseudomonas psychrotolerans]KTT52700.1 hemolysin secretion protein D [Pseudomonas psychrotolerans]